MDKREGVFLGHYVMVGDLFISNALGMEEEEEGMRGAMLFVGIPKRICSLISLQVEIKSSGLEKGHPTYLWTNRRGEEGKEMVGEKRAETNKRSLGTKN